MDRNRRPFYLIEVSMVDARTGQTLRGFSVVRKLSDGSETDWHRAGMMLKPKAERKRKAWNDNFERRLDHDHL
jgi:hypothetical protein